MEQQRCGFLQDTRVVVFHRVRDHDLRMVGERQSKYPSSSYDASLQARAHTYCIRTWHMFIAEYTSYFSAASASARRVSNGVAARLGWCMG